jgi:hypothetical protein
MFDRPVATEATFEVTDDPEHPLRLHVVGTGFVDRALPLCAMVGEVEVIQVRFWIGGDGFSGDLNALPSEGDVLRLGWFDDGDLVDTPVVYHASGNG